MSTLFWYSMIAGLATCLGGLLVVIVPNPQERFLALTLGCAAGIMTVVAALELIPSAWVYGTPGKFFSGFLGGVFFLYLLDLFLARLNPGASRDRDRRHFLNIGYLVATGIALHDLPEGMAIAVGYEAAHQLGTLIALAISLHNIPEGMAIGVPLIMAGIKGRVILGVTLAASIFTPLGTLIGIILVSFSKNFISILLAAAAGAMFYIVFQEIWPEAQRRHPNYARLGAVAGFSLILIVSLIA